ncbi:DUF6081 family protein [Streptomyces sp. MUM 178J]|uniref:DUF6081 family protein n=1 Tax=Streptomyces sp. MUM 178J TaxID=2791991 RepID=UPI001F044496|nr:DUF6081 family protein [Streptomyces sp. MUM 178J]WRQ82846.1 DUF6081 family protein [Streptomyces sp. MUM 178J]
MHRRTLLRGAAALGAAAAAATIPAGASHAAGSPAYDLVWDDFRSGFTTGGPDAKWTLTPTGSLPGGDGVPTTSAAGLRVVPTGVNPRTGAPAFVSTTAQEGDGGAGAYDHLKWYAVADHTSSAGFQGFDAVPGQVLTCSTTLSVRTHGTEQHPFGFLARNPDTDLRLAAGGLSLIDFETGMVFDFFVTNGRIHAFYERLHSPGATYAAFSYALPVADRRPWHIHDLAISYDRSAGTVAWTVDSREVLRVDRIGRLPADRTHLILDHGGTPETVAPRQLACALGTFTLLDAEEPGSRTPGGGLVRLSDHDAFYFDPDRGAPHRQRFADDHSRPENRLWGQGAELNVRRVGVSSLPS